MMSSLLALCLLAAPEAGVHAPPVDGQPLSVDWLRLTSGEWLNGKFLWLSVRDLAFDSDKTGETTWSLDDVTELYLVRTARFLFEDGTTRSGTGVLTADEVQLVDGETTRSWPRSAVVRVVGNLDTESAAQWTLNLTLGLDVVRGNSEQSAISIDTGLIRQSAELRTTLGYQGRLGSSLQRVGETTTPEGDVVPVTENRRNTNRHEGRLAMEWFFSQRFFWRVLDGGALYDEFRDIAVRAQPVSFLGYRIFDTPSLEFSVALGAGYQYTRFISDVDDISTGGPFASSDLSWELNSNVDLAASVVLFSDLGLGNSDNNQSSASLSGKIDVDITDATSLTLGGSYEFVAEPQGINPTTQQRAQSTDLAFLVGISVELE